MVDRKPKPIETPQEQWFMAQYQKRQRAKRAAVAAWLPTDLFQNGEVGFWYDPSDLTTLYQDSAGTTPVTGVEQPVGLMLDKSGNGFNATQPTAAAMPVLSARYNLLEQTEAFNSAFWFKFNSTITANNTTDPDGGFTADRMEQTSSSSTKGIIADAVSKSGNEYATTMYFKAGTVSIIQVAFGAGDVAGDPYSNIDLSDGTVISSGAITTTATGVGGGWYKVESVVTSSASVLGLATVFINSMASSRSPVISGSTANYVYIWGASVVESQYSELGYQRVGDVAVTASDYNSSGFPAYLRFDGVDDHMIINGLSAATGPITAHFGYVSDDGESVADQKLLDIQTGRAALAGVGNTSGTIGYFDTAWTEADIDTESLTVATFNLNASVAEIRANGAVVDSGATWTESAIGGTVSLGCTYTLGGGRLDGRLYSAILRNATSSASDIGEAESYINGKMGGGLL